MNDFSMQFDSFMADIHSDEFAHEWEEFSAMLDEIMREHMELDYITTDTFLM